MDRPGRSSRAKGLPLNASAESQLRLLDLQALDAGLDRLTHRRQTLPELATIDEFTARLREIDDALVVARTLDSDLAREQLKAEADVDQVRVRAERDQQRLDAGSVSSPRELENLQSEIASLGKRRSDLEDVVLEVMERREAAQGDIGLHSAEREKLAEELSATQERRDQAFTSIDAEITATSSARSAVAPAVSAELLALYEKIRSSSGGVGAAALHRGRCEGCHLSLTPGDIAKIRGAAPDEVLRCEECRRILVRTPESGL
ncbi:MAG: zinc ribbon domain-containing protein [Gaiellaceae bacterium]